MPIETRGDVLLDCASARIDQRLFNVMHVAGLRNAHHGSQTSSIIKKGIDLFVIGASLLMEIQNHAQIVHQAK